MRAIEFVKETTLQSFMPSIPAIYPRDVVPVRVRLRRRPIIYAMAPWATSIYLTTALCKGLRLKLLGYKGANPDFPDQSTADQFFDEEQFEAYREFGYASPTISSGTTWRTASCWGGRSEAPSIAGRCPPALRQAAE